MPVYRWDSARRMDSDQFDRRGPYVGIPAQHRRSIPQADGVAKAGRSTSARRIQPRAEPRTALDGVAVPRGFPIGDPTYRLVLGHPAYAAENDDAQTDPSMSAEDALATGAGSGRARKSAPERVAHSRVLQRVGTGRAPFRSAIVVGALLFAVLGAGVAAWAMVPARPDSDDVIVNQVDQPGATQSGATQSGATQSGVLTPGGPSAGGTPGSAPAAATNDQAPPAAAQVVSSPAVVPPTDLGPATVSAIQPGDPGFGWPSTAFGLPPETAAVQPGN